VGIDSENIVVLDASRYGVEVLKYYKPPHGFEEAATFTDSKALFEELWQEWQNTKLYLLAKGTPLSGKNYKGIFESLTDEEQAAINEKKQSSLNRLINRILIGKPEKIDMVKTQEVRIVYNFVGEL